MKDSISYIDINSLKFDPENPRLPTKRRNASEKKIIEWMLLDASLLELISSIGQNGFFRGEPLLVEKVKGKDEYIVIEGNRRLAASKLLNNPDICKVKKHAVADIIKECPPENVPSTLPVIVHNDRKEILDYLGYRHVTGVKSWGPLSKARYLNILFKNLKKSGSLDEKCKILAAKIGSKGPPAKRLLVAYWLFEILEENGFFKISGLEEETIEFSHLYDSLRYGGITKFLNVKLEQTKPLNNIKKDHFKEFSQWLYDRREGQTRLGESRNLKILNKVVDSSEALKAFRSGISLEEASQYSDYSDKLLETHIFNALSDIKLAVGVSTRAGKLGSTNEENLRSINKNVKMIINYFNDDLN